MGKILELIASGIVVFLITLFLQRRNINWIEISTITSMFIMLRITFIIVREKYIAKRENK